MPLQKMERFLWNATAAKFFCYYRFFLFILSYQFPFYIITVFIIYHHYFYYIPSIFFYIIHFLLDHHFSIKSLLFIIFQQIFSTIFLTIAFLSYHQKIIFFYIWYCHLAAKHFPAFGIVPDGKNCKLPRLQR